MKTCFHLGRAKEIKPCLFVQRYDKAKREETDIVEMVSLVIGDEKKSAIPRATIYP